MFVCLFVCLRISQSRKRDEERGPLVPVRNDALVAIRVRQETSDWKGNLMRHGEWLKTPIELVVCQMIRPRQALTFRHSRRRDTCFAGQALDDRFVRGGGQREAVRAIY